MLDIWYARVGSAKPFLKWAGGKRQFIHEHPELIPEFSGQYIEPFLGSGAVFFHAMKTRGDPCNARLGDTNRTLIRAFLAVRDDPEGVHEELEHFQSDFGAAADRAAFYYEVRDRFNDGDRTPARFIFLNQTCWNGLYRVNRKGQFNVPFGARKSERVVPTLAVLQAASAALTRADLRATSWEHSVAQAAPGDFVFLDPPYFSDLGKGDVKYQKQPFSRAMHEALADTLHDLSIRGVDFLLTNSGESEMIDLYRSRGLSIQCIEQPRSINSNAQGRQRVQEVVVRPGSGEIPRVDLETEIILLRAASA